MATLVIPEPEGGHRAVPLGEGRHVIGRSTDATIRFSESTVSQLHAVITVGTGGPRILDAGSRNGVRVNGRRVEAADLEDGDRIRLGEIVITFLARDLREEEATAAALEALAKAAAKRARRKRRRGREHVPAGEPRGTKARRAKAEAGEEAGEKPEEIPYWVRTAPYWAISTALHLVLLLILSAFVLIEARPPEEIRTLLVRRQYEPAPYNPALKRDMFRRPLILDRPRREQPIIQLKIDRLDIPKGTDLDRFSNKNLEGQFAVDAIGIGGGLAGAYGNRLGKGSLIREGGGPATEKAVLAALMWLMRHQSPDGSWSCHDFTARCGRARGTKGRVCRNKTGGHGDGRGMVGHDVAVTGLALLAFTGTGHTHMFGERPEFVEVVRKGMRYLKRVQVTDPADSECGRFGPRHDKQWIYDQALATMALGELLVLTDDRIALQKPVEFAANLCLRARNEGLGWRYGIRTGETDSSVTGWMVLALKTTMAAEIPRPGKDAYRRAFQGALRWYRSVTDASRGAMGYRSPGDARRKNHSSLCMTAVGILCRIFAGERRTSPVIRKGVEYISTSPPVWEEARGRNKINLYYWYYASYALFQYGGKPWQAWNPAMKKALLASQRVGGCEDGSWDPIGQWGGRGGRVYATALGAMTLEVYYRFRRAHGGGFAGLPTR